MDDDNTYSTELFDEMSKISPGKVGIWPVGLVAGLKVEKPIVENNTVTGFNTLVNPKRTFAIDMAGFAVSVDLLEKNPDAVFRSDVRHGYLEDDILNHLTTRDVSDARYVNALNYV